MVTDLVTEQPGMVFVRYYLELPMASEEVEEALLASPDRWIPRLAREANRRGEQLLAEVGAKPQTGPLRKAIKIALGDPLRMPTRMLLPLTWEATESPGLFPAFSADLEVASLGQNRSQLSISGRYRRPVGVVGQDVDRVLLHRVAEAIVKDFVDRVGERLLSASVARG